MRAVATAGVVELLVRRQRATRIRDRAEPVFVEAFVAQPTGAEAERSQGARRPRGR